MHNASPMEPTPTPDDFEYAGFWVRVGAALIDTALILCFTVPLILAVYGPSYYSLSQTSPVAGMADILITWVAPAVAAMAFWHYKQATPGKMAVSARVVDAKTGHKITIGQAVVRYLGYFVSTIPFGLGILWVGFDRKKQGWHDKMAGTVVIRARKRGPEPVKFGPG